MSADKRDPGMMEERPCVECHDKIGRAFAATQMARAAAGAEFLAEWQEKDRPGYCFECHAPSGGEGLVCADCHGSGPHPYSRVKVPDACAPCHDAPGENTVRRFLESPAARRQEDCLDCHLPGEGDGSDHRFEGPSVSGFLSDVASLRLFLRQEAAEKTTAVIQVRHEAGHALPGGTTGRSVWLLVKGLRHDGTEAWREQVRFGWEHHPDKGWLDRTLPPGRQVVLELPQPGRNLAVRIKVELIYRFLPGSLESSDPKAVLLDAAGLELP